MCATIEGVIKILIVCLPSKKKVKKIHKYIIIFLTCCIIFCSIDLFCLRIKKENTVERKKE